MTIHHYAAALLGSGDFPEQLHGVEVARSEAKAHACRQLCDELSGVSTWKDIRLRAAMSGADRNDGRSSPV